MKRLFCLLLTILMLCGCGSEAQQTQPPTEAVPATVTEPSGYYDPDSTVEMFTGGAVRAYPLEIPDVYAIAVVGRDLLVFSGVGSTKITRLSGENLYQLAQIQLDVTVSPGDPGLLIQEDQVVYYDKYVGEMVYLDATFREFNRLKVPSGITGSPVLSADCRKLYYCTAEGVRVLDVEQGISRLLKQSTTTKQNAVSLLMEDTVLLCFAADDDEQWEAQYLNVETGELLNRAGVETGVSSGAGLYYAYAQEDSGISLLFGRAGERTRELLPLTGGEARFLPNAAAALVYAQRDGHWMLDYYDLSSGCLFSSVLLPETVSPWQYACDPEQNRVYFLSSGEAESEILYRWDVDATLMEDTAVYTDDWYTQENPDVKGLEVCQSKADALGQRYGLDIRIWQDALKETPWDYQLTGEYRTGIIENALDRLEILLADFPEDFFVKAMEGMEGLHLCLVRSLSGGQETGSLDSADGIQFWKGSEAYVVLALDEGLEKTFYHEMFHALETRAMSRSIAYYRWDELNPKGFRYDNDYVANRYRDGSEYLQDDTTRAFIDVYSMSFAREDRARIFEYACMEGNSNYFLSATMQRKLRTLCEGIREAYDLEKSPEAFLWEQYLELPLAWEAT